MKVEIVESLCYSYLRHVKKCWLVQSNWKVSEHWSKKKSGPDLEALFDSMRQDFDPDGSVFKKTKTAAQFLKQGEIDVVGVDQVGVVHAIDAAFHESGLNYGGASDKRVLKKLLRTAILLQAYLPLSTKCHVYFVSPKVNPAVQQSLKTIFLKLRKTNYSEITWHLITNDDFTNEIVGPTLKETSTVADTSELFVRAAKLLHLTGLLMPTKVSFSPTGNGHPRCSASEPPVARKPQHPPGGSLQDAVRGLMRILLEEHPSFLTDADLANLTNAGYCRNTLALRLGNLPLLRQLGEGRTIAGHPRYWAEPYAGLFYVNSQWWKTHHLENARRLLTWVSSLADRNSSHPGLPALERCRADLLGVLNNTSP